VCPSGPAGDGEGNVLTREGLLSQRKTLPYIPVISRIHFKRECMMPVSAKSVSEYRLSSRGRNRTFFRHPGYGSGVLAVVAFAILLLSLPACLQAQGWWWGSKIDSGYDPQTVLSVKGTVTEIASQERSGPVSLSLQAENEQYTVMLGPQWYLKKLGFRVQRGDGVHIQGSRMLDRQGKVYLVAASISIEKTGERIQLRDDSGSPLWSGKMKRGGREGGPK